uniref:Uncharacterized protein n=1 Tax=Tanacetum cinerariifolium TaxID=118510 RepID=A0A6L2P4W1_TANCI|nr:hypothetical protein [Tanacetum cinerariifolium]
MPNNINFQLAVVKNINGEAQLHAKVDGKKVVISEASIRRDLWFRDKGGIDCLPNETIFEQLSLMGAKTTAWNEFSSTIASAVICLAPDQKFNFTKYIFNSMKPRKTRRQDTELPQSSVPTETVVDEAVNEEMYNNLERATIIATILDTKQDRGNIKVIKDITTAGIEETVSTAAPITSVVTIDELTLAQALAKLKSAKPKADKAEEQEQLTDAEKARLFMEFLEKRRKFFATKRAEEKRNKPPTKAQQRSLMNGNSQMYLTFSKLLKNFDREDLEVL